MALYGIPWMVFGIQHFMYASFVKDLVPAYVPVRIFWVYFTAVAMIAAGVSFIIRRQVQLAAFLLSCMLLLFILLLHPLLLAKEPQVGMHWTRVMQDTAIMGAALGLAIVWGRRSGKEGPVLASGKEEPVPVRKMDGTRGWRAWLASPKASVIARYCYALPLVVLGAQHFTHNAFVTAKVPGYFPLKDIFDYLIGIMLMAAAYGILFTVRIGWTCTRLGVILMLLLLLYHVPLLAADVYAAVEWTGAMLDLALAAGAFIIAETAGP